MEGWVHSGFREARPVGIPARDAEDTDRPRPCTSSCAVTTSGLPGAGRAGAASAPLVLAEEPGKFFENRGVYPALDEPSALAGLDEPGLPQFLQMMRRSGRSDVQALGEIAHAPACVALSVTRPGGHAAGRQSLEELQAMWVRQGREDRGVSFNVLRSTFRHVSNCRFGVPVCQARTLRRPGEVG